MKTIYISILLSVFFAISCGKNNEPAQENQTEQTQIEPTSNEIVFEIDSSDLIISCMGKIMVPPQGLIEINSGIAAHVYGISVLPGSYVKKGEKLAYLKNRSLIDLQSNYISAFYQLDALEKEFKRKSELLKEKAISDKEYISSESNFKTQKALVDGMTKELKYLGFNTESILKEGVIESLNIYAPVSGQIEQVHAHEGVFIAENQAIFTLIDASSLHVDLEIFAKDAAFVQQGQVIRFSVPGTGKTFESKIHLVGAGIDPYSNTISAHGEIKTPIDQALKVGMVVTAEIITGKKYRYLLAENLVQFDNDEKPFLIKNGNKIELQLGEYKNGKYDILNYKTIELN